jgi:TolB-like protein/DNA-binding winged helix-turn-helix (wHTH) protein
LRFGPFDFDPEAGTLWRDGRVVPLQPQPARVLASLVARPGAIVTREELRQAIWGDATFVDFERGLNFCIAQIRTALRERAASPHYIETLPKRGYRFIASIAPGGTEAVPERSLSRRAVVLWGSAAAALVLTIATAAVVIMRPAAIAAPRVVVVPFDNETGSAEFDRVAKGVSDATVAQLATPERLRQLRVIGNASGLKLSFARRDLKAMGDSLNAQYLVLGQMKRDEHRFRIVAHLIRVSDQSHVWARTFDRDGIDLETQSALAEEIAKAVVARIPSS